MIFCNDGMVNFGGKPIDVLVDMSVMFEEFLRCTPEELRPLMLDAIKSSADLSMKMVERDESRKDSRADEEVLRDYAAKSIYFKESEEE